MKLRNNLGKEQFDKILQSHLIDPKYLENDDWEGFVNDRRAKLLDLVKDTCGSVIQPFADTIEELEIEEDED